MAARRLIAIMLVLLFVSSLAAALAPVSDEPGGDTSTTSETTETAPEEGRPAPDPAPVASGGALRSESVKLGGDPETIRARAGDQLQLRATAARPMTLELVPLGVAEDAAPGAPALFDVLLSEAGTVELRELGGRRALAKIQVGRSRR